MKWQKVSKWLTIILGMALCVAPFVVGYSDNSTALWTSLILGAVVVILGFMEQYTIDTLVGTGIVLAPLIFGFVRLPAALWSCVLVGIAVTVVNGYKVSTEREAEEADSRTGSMQHHHS